MKMDYVKCTTLAKHLIFCLFLLCGTSSLEFYERTKLERFFASNKTMVKAFSDHVKLLNSQKQKPGYNFNCTIPKSAEKPHSVHRLRPGDIDVVAAMGDSITAGTGVEAHTILGLLLQFRGLSWSIGGDETLQDVVTLPNILKYYNPKLKGYSVKLGTQNSENSHLNVAEPGAKAHNLPYQAHLLVDRLRSEPGIDFQRDWKVITVFIGGDDLCDYCFERKRENSPQYIEFIQEALDILHASVPRAFVNLVPTIDVTMVKELNIGIVCSALHLWKCRCGAFPENVYVSQELESAVRQYQRFTRELIQSGRYDTRDDFTVVFQPFTQYAEPPLIKGRPDASFFAPDCFHLSEKGHAAAAIALWNNMVQPVGQKQKHWVPGGLMTCPSVERPYFFTSRNSIPGFNMNNIQELNAETFLKSIPHEQFPMKAVISVLFLVIALCLVLLVMWYKRKSENMYITYDRL